MTDEESAPRLRLRPNPQMAAVSGIDAALIAQLEEQFAQTFDLGMMNRTQLKTSLGVLHEALSGGPLMDYFATLKAEATQAMTIFADLDPTNPILIMQSQDAIRRFDHLIKWMQEYISAVPRQPTTESQPEDI